MRDSVVNCFQIVFLLWSLTTWAGELLAAPGLWIAFKLYFYCGLWQRPKPLPLSKICCELLSNCIFTVVFDNAFVPICSDPMVVNCFQIVFLLWSLTTARQVIGKELPLWIAFKLYFYCGLWQPCIHNTYFNGCCELLSNCIFTVVFDNGGNDLLAAVFVVNCFQIVFLLWSLTTGDWNGIKRLKLWIAFKLYFYCGLWQRR